MNEADNITTAEQIVRNHYLNRISEDEEVCKRALVTTIAKALAGKPAAPAEGDVGAAEDKETAQRIISKYESIGPAFRLVFSGLLEKKIAAALTATRKAAEARVEALEAAAGELLMPVLELEKEASPGPWEVSEDYEDDGVASIIIARDGGGSLVVTSAEKRGLTYGFENGPDVILVVALRNVLPKLAALLAGEGKGEGAGSDERKEN